MERKRKKVTALVNSKAELWGQEKGVYFEFSQRVKVNKVNTYFHGLRSQVFQKESQMDRS